MRKRLPRGISAQDMAHDVRFGLSRENSPSTASVSSIGSIASPIAGLQGLSHTPGTKKRVRCHLCEYSMNATWAAARCDNCKRPFVHSTASLFVKNAVELGLNDYYFILSNNSYSKILEKSKKKYEFLPFFPIV